MLISETTMDKTRFFHLFFVATLVAQSMRTGSLSSSLSVKESPNILCIESERQALLNFSQSAFVYDMATKGERDCCRWEEVWCDNQTGHIIGLNLGIGSNNFFFEDTISPSLLELSHLSYLDLSYNDFEGKLPDFIGSFHSLTHLILSGNQFKGEILDQIGNLSSLQVLDLQHNELESPIPKAFGSMISLKHLDLSHNHLLSEIPDQIGNLSRLQFLDLSHNHLSGEIPQSFAKIHCLSLLDFSHNSLTGPLHVFLDHLSDCSKNNLVHLNFSRNQLWGSLPDLAGKFINLMVLDVQKNRLNGTLFGGFGNLSSLEILNLAYNSLEGSLSEVHFSSLSKLLVLDFSLNSLSMNLNSSWVPPFQLDVIHLKSCKLGPDFPIWIQTQRSYSSLDISNCGISGVAPMGFWELSPELTYLNLSNNCIRGIIPSLSSKLTGLVEIDLSSNQFWGHIPPFPQPSVTLDLSKNLFSGQNNFFCGIPYPNLIVLDLSDNLLSGGFPDCQLQLKGLCILNLENNNLSGVIPYSITQLQSIETLHLNSNNFFGEIPPYLISFSNLKVLDLGENKFSGKIPESIGGMFWLQVLSLQSNKLNGSIPSNLCNLYFIQILDLSFNNLTGSIPDCLENFYSMRYHNSSVHFRNQSRATITFSDSFIVSRRVTIDFAYNDHLSLMWKGKEYEYRNTLGLIRSIDLSSNNLAGEIPTQITKLVLLQNLNLSRNNIGGAIPPEFGRLQLLESIDLSRNQLCGEIPQSISNLDFLAWLDLSHNKLSGKIPTGTQLQTFNASQYDENSGLCGQPLTKECPADGNPLGNEKHKSNNSDDDEIIGPGFYCSLGPGFATGFWAVFGTLLFNRSWRQAYFRCLDDIKDSITFAVWVARFRRQLP